MGNPTDFPKLRGAAVTPELARAQDNVNIVTRPVAQALSQTPIMGAAPPPWNYVEYVPDFVDVSSVLRTRYQKDALGYVHLEVWASTPGGKVAGSTIFTFPIGLRPSQAVSAAMVNQSTATILRIRVDPDGSVVTTGAAMAAFDSLTGSMSFLAER